jgi:hypothetical protein
MDRLTCLTAESASYTGKASRKGQKKASSKKTF